MANRKDKIPSGQDMMGDALNDAKNKNIEGLMSKLNAEDRKKVESILSDPEETKKILSNPKVRELIRKLKGNG